jgi:hypothetical protein
MMLISPVDGLAASFPFILRPPQNRIDTVGVA